MSWYRRTIDSLRRNINPEILPRSHVSSKIQPKGSSNHSAKFSGLSSISSREVRLGSWTFRMAYSRFVGHRSHASSIIQPYSNHSAKFSGFSSISSREVGLGSWTSVGSKTNRLADIPAMSWYPRTKLVFDSLRRNINPKILPRSHVSSIIQPKGVFNYSAKFSGFSSISSGKVGLGSWTSVGKAKRIVYSPFVGCAKRFYYVDRYQVRHFKPRGPRRWFQNPRTALTVVLVSLGGLITLYFGNLETVPYTKRTHFVLLSKPMEKRIGETQFEQMKKTYEGKILPAIHPESIRVRLIAKEIIDALQRGLSHEREWSDLGYASMDSTMRGSDKGMKEAISEGGDQEMMSGMKWSKEDEILDDKWVQESRKKDLQAASSHLEGINWEILVVNEPIVNAFCLPAGKIVVFTGLLEHFKSDAEVATVIGHEVGHAVARHVAEGITKNLWFAILQLVLYQFVMPDLVNTMSALFLRLPFSRKMEIEADYIGLLLLASAGYDPRVAPTVYEKLGKLGGNVALGEYLSTHPSGKKRSQLLAQAHVMEEALMIYREVQAGRGLEGFL